MRIFSTVFAFLLGASVTLFASASSVAGETPWIDHEGMAQTRVVTASSDLTTSDGVLLAWEVKLADGWKTYWRSPGEAGLPVRVFYGATEIAPLYPFPKRFELFGIQTYGYSHQLLLPFRLQNIPTGDVKLRVEFMVCKDICVPIEQLYTVSSTDIAQSSSAHDIRIETWLAKVPDPIEQPNSPLEILGAKVVGSVGHQKIIVDVRGDMDLSKADMLAEVNDMFYFGLPKVRLSNGGKKARFILPAMTNKKTEDLRGLTVRLSFTDGHGFAIDRKIPLPK